MADAQVVVVKLGSNALVDAQGQLDQDFLADVAAQLATVKRQGWTPVVVSSGAVACGLSAMGLARKPDDLPAIQALAAIGQADLMRQWQAALSGQDLTAAQLLLTADDFRIRARYLNLSAALRSCFAYGVLPIINENDTVVVDELTVGDNDRLSALVAGQLGAGRLLLLTDIDGYYDQDPRSHPEARLVGRLNQVSAAMLEAAGGSGSRGRGGMRSKLQAAALAAGAGVTVTIARARVTEVIPRVIAGEEIGTTVLPRASGTPSSRRRWLGLARHPKGRLRIDAGALKAIAEDGRSLLPAGITAVEGEFERGDIVAIVDESGSERGRGLASLSGRELAQVTGMRMDAASRLLGYALPKAAVHRDNLMLLG